MTKRSFRGPAAAIASAAVVSLSLLPALAGTLQNAVAAGPCNVADASLRGYWKFDEGTGTTTADSSGKGHTGTLENGPVWVASGTTLVTPNPASLSFDGTNDHVRTSGASDMRFGTGSFTVSLFSKTGSGSGDRAVLGKFNGTNRGWGLYYYPNNTVNFFAYGSAGINDVAQPGTILDNQWHHVAGVFTRSGSSLKIDTYVNGVLAGSNTADVGDITATNDLLLGHYNSQPHFKGMLDEIRVFARAMTPAEVANLSTGCTGAGSSASSASSMSSSMSSSNSSTSTGSSVSSSSMSSSSVSSSVSTSSASSTSMTSSSVSSSSSTSSMGPVPACNGIAATIYGRSGNIKGTDGNDVIVGSNGDDDIDGKGGNDIICGRNGEDDIRGDDGNDWVDGEGGADDIKGGDGNDTLIGSGGEDEIRGDDGDDVIMGMAGSDELEGKDGNDVLCGGGDTDELEGDDGNDQLDGGGGSDSLKGDDDSDTCRNGESNSKCETLGGPAFAQCQ